jgi:hypothetical protein
MTLQTEFEFTLPRGYIDREGNIHKNGLMHLSTAMDEIAPLRDLRVKSNQAYLAIILLSRVITKLGNLPEVHTGIIESLYSADFNYLQNFYRQINENGTTKISTTCPECNEKVEIDISQLGE